MDLAGQAAIVTGGGSGLGRAMALGLAREGARVVVADIRQRSAESVREEILGLGGETEIFVGDVSREEDAVKLIGLALDRFHGLDVLINNAGLRMEEHEDGLYETSRCLLKRPTHELPIADWDLVLDTNLRGVFLCTHFALPHMIKQNRGTIISLSSNAGSRGVAGKSAYCASKHAVEGLMKTVAEETRDYRIRANAIHPGGRVNVDGRGGQSPEVVVPLVLFLCSQDDSSVSGQTIAARIWNAEHGI